MKIRWLYIIGLLGSLFVLTQCQMVNSLTERSSYTVAQMQHQWIAIDSTTAPDSSWQAFLKPYQDSLQTYFGEILAHSTQRFDLGKPESPLTNLAADMLRRRASREMRKEVAIGITNNGSLRTSLPEGDITRGHLYEMMPFDDHLVVLKLSGTQVLTLAHQIARQGGQALSGMRMRIDGYKAEDVLVGSESILQSKQYWVATNSYLADGNGPFSVLWSPQERLDFDITIREVFEQYLNNRQTVRPEIDNRIRM